MDSSIAQNVYENADLNAVLDDLCVRFIVHLPNEELKSVERMCFQIEEAHWYYEDFVREFNAKLPTFHLRKFIVLVFSRVPRSLISHLDVKNAENAFADFMLYKTRVPVRGVIMLNTRMDQCVLVKGWKSGSSWSFPRGKIDQDEDDRDCAIRETMEETGHNLKGKIGPNDFIEINIREQNVKLFIAPGVPENTHFAPRTRKEISKIEWHKLSDLPGYSRKGPKPSAAGTRFYMVAPFLKDIRKWVASTGKKWLESQQNAATTQQTQLSPATVGMANTEDETEVEEDIFQSPPRNNGDTAEGLKSLLGIEKSAEVIRSGHMTGAEQEEASKRLKAMLSGFPQPVPEASPPVSKTNGVNGGGGGGISLAGQNGSPNGQTNALTPSAKTLLSILQSAPSQQANPEPPNPEPPNPEPPSPARQPPSQPTPSSQNFQSHLPRPPSYVRPDMMQNQSYRQSANQYGYAQQHQQSPVSMPQHPPMQENVPTRQTPYAQQQQIHRSPGYPVGSVPYHLPSPPPTSRFGVPLPPPTMNQQQSTFSQDRPSGQMNHFGGPMNMPPSSQPQSNYPQNNHQQAFQRQSPLTPVEPFLPTPVPSKPLDPGQAGALLSILKSKTTPPAATSPAATSKPAQQITPPSKAATPSLASPPAPRTHVSLQPAPPPRGPRSQVAQRRQRPRAPSRPGTSEPPSAAFTPPPHRPGTTLPRSHQASTPPLRKSTPTVLDQYGQQKKASPMPPTNFDRRESVTGQQAQTLLAMFRTDIPSQAQEEAVTSSPETPSKVRPVIPAIERLSTPASASRSKSPSRQKSHAPTPSGKNKDSLLAYLEGVALSGK